MTDGKRETPARRINWRLALGGALLLILLLFGVAVAGWLAMAYEPMADANAALTSDDRVTVESDGWLVFRPTITSPESGLIIHPGANVSPAAYAPIARAIAERGHLAVIVPAPLNLALFSPNRAREVIAAFPDISSWVIAGHSLGGVVAANFAENQPDSIQGLALWAAYPAESVDLSDNELAVLSIYGTRDGLTSAADIDASRRRLPEDTRWIAIDGGNHAQFGSYGEQSGDNPAEISREEQQAQIISATLELLQSLSEPQ